MSKKRITLERVYRADIQDVRELWTTKDGIASWWGPGGFAVTVRKLDLRPGGELLYAMTAVAPLQMAFTQKSGMPLTHECRIKFTDVIPQRRLAYVHLADIIPGVAAYHATTIVELEEASDGVRMTLTIEPMRYEEWTRRAVMGSGSRTREA